MNGGTIAMKEQNHSKTPNRSLKVLERAALASAYAGANSLCMWFFHDPKKPEALSKLKKF